MKKLRRSFQILHKNQQGMMLLSVILILGLAGLIIAPLLGFMGTGLKVTQAQVQNSDLLYAADAGANDAIWKIQNAVAGVPRTSAQAAYTYTLTNLNGMSAGVTISMVDNDTYKVVSVASNSDGSDSTTIESTMDIVNFRMFTEEAITSPGSIVVKPNGTIAGDIWSPNITLQPGVTFLGNKEMSAVSGWPTITQIQLLKAFYGRQVNKAAPYANTSINLPTAGPLYAFKSVLDHDFSMVGNGQLGGTLYVKGDLELGQNSTTYLNGQTIFVEGDFNSYSTSILEGPGAILVLGSVVFLPKMLTLPNEYIYVMSVTSSVTFQPLNDFTGAVAGNGEVSMQPGCTLYWDTTPEDLNLPGINVNLISEIKTWIIK